MGSGRLGVDWGVKCRGFWVKEGAGSWVKEFGISEEEGGGMLGSLWFSLALSICFEKLAQVKEKGLVSNRRGALEWRI